MVGKGRLSKSSRSYSEREIDEEIGRRIRDLRVKAGYSQQRVGDHLHVSYQQVQKYEKGETRLSTAKLQEIADLFGVGIAHFFGDFAPGQSDIERLLQESTTDVETPAGRRIAQLLRYFRSIRGEDVRESILDMVRSFAEADAAHRRGGIEDPTGDAGEADNPDIPDGDKKPTR